MSKTKLFDPETEKHLQQWLNGPYDQQTKEEILRLMREDPQAALDAFYTTLSFGTGGLRGVVGVGSNRMNAYTVMTATQGLANYLKKQVKERPSVLIGYDSRHESPSFAQDAARVLAANGIQVYLYRHLRPTPLVSFGCRHLQCSAAIMVTASHNPPYYNGYKVYWSDGGQVLPPHDEGIIQEVAAIQDFSAVQSSPLNDPLIHWIEDEVDSAYLQAIKDLTLYPHRDNQEGETLKVIYSNLHGTGITLVPKALAQWGFNCALVAEQAEPNGDFPTVKSANPEEPAALHLGIQQLMQTKGDLLLATDPDADRVGVVVLHEGRTERLTGNQVAALCLESICRALSAQGRMPIRPACVKTVVTTPLFQAIANRYGVSCFNVLPGFKYISAKIHEWEDSPEGYSFIFGGEESYGYLRGTASRDKDGVVMCAVISEIALRAKREGKTLLDLLQELYETYGIYRETLHSLNFPESKEGREEMVLAMKNLRQHPPEKLLNIPLLSSEDYLTHAPSSDILHYTLQDGSWVIVRPSGTEPKVKLYAGVTQGESVARCDEKLGALLAEVQAKLRV